MQYTSHYSAARLWDIPFLDLALGSYGAKRSLSNAVDITLTNSNERYQRKKHIVHYCLLDLPPSARVHKDGALVSSPPLVFLELAPHLDLQQVILLGLLLVAHQTGKPSTAITTKQRIESLVNALPTHKGYYKAKQALKYIENGASSLMEAIAFMLLTLPYSLGGYGLAGAVLNHEVALSKPSQERLNQRRCFIDLYYPEFKLAVEYDSFAHHNTPAQQAKDMLRASALERQGISTMRFSTMQLYKRSAFEEFANNLATRLNRRIRIRNKKFEAAHKALRALLPQQSPKQPPSQ